MSTPAGKSKIPVLTCSAKTPVATKKCSKQEIPSESTPSKLPESLTSKNNTSSSLKFQSTPSTKIAHRRGNDPLQTPTTAIHSQLKTTTCDKVPSEDYNVDKNNNQDSKKDCSNYQQRSLVRSLTFSTSKESCCLTGEAKSKMKNSSLVHTSKPTVEPERCTLVDNRKKSMSNLRQLEDTSVTHARPAFNSKEQNSDLLLKNGQGSKVAINTLPVVTTTNLQLCKESEYVIEGEKLDDITPPINLSSSGTSVSSCETVHNTTNGVITLQNLCKNILLKNRVQKTKEGSVDQNNRERFTKAVSVESPVVGENRKPVIVNTSCSASDVSFVHDKNVEPGREQSNNNVVSQQQVAKTTESGELIQAEWVYNLSSSSSGSGNCIRKRCPVQKVEKDKGNNLKSEFMDEIDAWSDISSVPSIKQAWGDLSDQSKRRASYASNPPKVVTKQPDGYKIPSYDITNKEDPKNLLKMSSVMDFYREEELSGIYRSIYLIRNPTDECMTFKLICSHPMRYKFHPEVGYIKPKDKVCINIEAKFNHSSERKEAARDLIKILSSSIQPGQYEISTLQSYWQMMLTTKSKEYFQELKISKINFHESTAKHHYQLGEKQTNRISKTNRFPELEQEVATEKMKTSVKIQMGISDSLYMLTDVGSELRRWIHWLQYTCLLALCVFIYTQNAHLFVPSREKSDDQQQQKIEEETFGQRLYALVADFLSF